MNDEKIVQAMKRKWRPEAPCTCRSMAKSICSGCKFNAAMLEDLELLIREAISLSREQKWIPCSERLPNKGERVLLFYRGDTWTGRLEIKPSKKTRALWLLPTGSTNDGITHWMPLPSAPLTDVSTDEVEDRKEE